MKLFFLRKCRLERMRRMLLFGPLLAVYRTGFTGAYLALRGLHIPEVSPPRTIPAPTTYQRNTAELAPTLRRLSGWDAQRQLLVAGHRWALPLGTSPRAAAGAAASRRLPPARLPVERLRPCPHTPAQ